MDAFRSTIALVAVVLTANSFHCRKFENGTEPQPQLRWTSISPASGAQPSPRYNATAVYDSATNSMIVYGGRGPAGNLSEIWSFNLSTASWTNLTPSDTSPPARFAHVAAFDPATRNMVLWSGQGVGFYNDSWAFDLTARRWQNVTPPGSRPAVRYGSAGVRDPQTNGLVIFAGFTDQGRFDDTWEYSIDGLQWTDLTPTGIRPPSRCLHAATYDQGTHSMLMYGGQRSGPLDDIWAFSLASRTWSDLTPVDRPVGRLFATITSTGNGKAVVFGGYTDAGEVNDTWMFDVSTRAWELLTIPAPLPPPRQGHTAVYVPQLDWLVIFGGNSGSVAFNEVWVLENLSSR